MFKSINICISLLALSVSFSALAQYKKGQFNIELAGGYSFSTSSIIYEGGMDASNLGEAIRSEIGEGTHIGIRGAYFISDDLSVGLAVSAFFGNEFSYYIEETPDPLQMRYKMTQYFFTPTIGFSKSLSQNWAIQLVAGPSIGVGEMEYAERLRILGEGIVVDGRFNKYKGGYSYGAHTALRGIYELTNSLSLIAEVSIEFMKYKPKRLILEELYQNGTSIDLGLLSRGQKEAVFYDNPDEVEWTVDDPIPALTQIISWSNLAFRLGIQYSF